MGAAPTDVRKKREKSRHDEESIGRFIVCPCLAENKISAQDAILTGRNVRRKIKIIQLESPLSEFEN